MRKVFVSVHQVESDVIVFDVTGKRFRIGCVDVGSASAMKALLERLDTPYNTVQLLDLGYHAQYLSDVMCISNYY